MATLTKATIGNSASIFIRDVLRQNLTDPQDPDRTDNWVFLSHERGNKRLKGNLPKVFLDMISSGRDTINLDPSTIKTGPVEMTFTAEVWDSGSSALSNRDTVADEIVSILEDPTNTDGTNTIRSQNLRYKSSDMSTEDIIMNNILLRRKFVDLTMNYGGA